MQIINDLNILWIIGASQGFLLTMFLILKKDRRINSPLILFVFLTSVELFFQYIYASELIFQYPHLLYISEPFSMLSGVLIFFYARNILSGAFILRKSDLLFFIPFLLYVIYYFPSYNQSAEDKVFDIIDFYNAGISWDENLYEWIAEVIVTIPFLIFSVRLSNKYHKRIKENFSDISKISYKVVRNLVIAFAVLYFLEILTIILAYTKPQIAVSLNSFLFVFVIGIVYMLGYDALVRKNTETVKLIYIQENQSHETSEVRIKTENSEIEITPKYKKNSLPDSKLNEISKKIECYITNEKPYRNPELRLNDLALLIQEHPHHVSQVINDTYKKNFYDFINFYRIEESKILLKSHEFNKFTITAIGFEVGFNSKSAFYSSFKKLANITPVQFKKMNSTE
jgi:AraC-like DNA-binding protein